MIEHPSSIQRQFFIHMRARRLSPFISITDHQRTWMSWRHDSWLIVLRNCQVTFMIIIQNSLETLEMTQLYQTGIRLTGPITGYHHQQSMVCLHRYFIRQFFNNKKFELSNKIETEFGNGLFECFKLRLSRYSNCVL